MQKSFNEVVLFARTGLNPRTNFKLGRGTNKYITIKNIRNNQMIIDDNTDVVDDDAISLIHKRSQIKKGDILFCSIGRLGDMFIIDEDPVGWDINESVFAFTLDTDVIRQKYFYYLFKNRDTIEYLSKNSSGSTFKSIKMNQLKKMEFDLPSLEEQDQIVQILDSATSIIESRQLELTKLDELIKARFVELFGDPSVNSMNWEKHRFDSLCENLDGRRRPITSTDRVAGPYPYYGASGIVDYVEDYIFDEDILLISEDGANLLARSTPIAFSVSGKVWVNNHAHVVRFKDYSLQKYIENYFELISIEDYVTGSAQPKLNQAKLNGMMIPIPEKERLDRYLCFIEQVDKSKVIVQKSLKETQLLFDSLMQEYFG